MQIKPDQLGTVLQKGLMPVYFISGEEPLQLDEITDAIRKAARKSGFSSRDIFSVETGFEWNRLKESADSLSIFADKKIIDLRLPSGSPGNDGARVLTAYAEHLPEDTLLLVTAGKLAKEALKSRWFQALDKAGVVIQVWPLEGQDLIRWLQQRLQRRGISADSEAIGLLASRVEGNLLAAAQEVENLYVLYGASQITGQQIIDVVADSSRYDVFKLTDTVLAANVTRIFKVLSGLQSEGVAAPVVLWSLTREARVLIRVKEALASGQNKEAVFRNNQVWDKRKQLVNDALSRLSYGDLSSILVICAKADRQVKGQLSGNAWETLREACLMFASVKVMAKTV